MQYLKYGIVVLFFVWYGCSIDHSNEDVFAMDGTEVQLQYFETQCNDPWNGYEETDFQGTESQKIQQMVVFLEQLQIEVLAASYTFDKDAALACLACECQTGGVYYIKIKNKQEIILELYDLGFIK